VPNGRVIVSDEEKGKCKERNAVYCIRTKTVKGTVYNKLTDRPGLTK